jgi:SAM-dependent methyltransferase
VVLRHLLLPLLVLTSVLVLPPTRSLLRAITRMLSVFQDMVIWSGTTRVGAAETVLLVFLGLFLTFLLMVLVWDMFVPLGRLMGRLIEDHPSTIRGYSLNVAGSLLGIWLFVLLSALSQPPWVWIAVLGGLLVFFLGPSRPAGRLDLALLAAILALSFFAKGERGSTEVVWSPYQKLVLKPVRSASEGIGQYRVEVNNTDHQEILDLSRQRVRSDRERYPAELEGFSQYDIPLLLHPRPRNVLIVGAGTGNDAAGALRHGADRITAVDIDPAILSMGRRYHPENPYAMPQVRLVNDDARSFFSKSKDRYDLIVFGLLDAHTATSMTNTRLDHYVYTRESLSHAKSLLAEGGVMVLTFFVTRDFIADRMGTVLREVFGEAPMVWFIPPSSYGRGGIMFVAGDLAAVKRQVEGGPLRSRLERWRGERPVPLSYSTKIATDDWPYIYLRSRGVPVLYFLLAGMMVLLFVRGRRRVGTRSGFRDWTRSSWHFFFLGAAFMLLEVQNISKASVALGSTWWVNAVIISGVLFMVLLANAIVAKWPALPIVPVYVSLCGACILLFFVDIARFAFLPYGPRAVVVGALTSLPMLFSGIVFIRSFTAVSAKSAALGANLIGALVGGLLQSVTFVTGIRALLLIVTALYVAAIVTRPAARRSGRRPLYGPAG